MIARIILLLVLLFPFAISSEDLPPVKIGAILHLTGEYPMEGGAFREGVELAVEEINKGGGVSGRQVELVVEDSQYNPRTAHTIAKKMLSVDKVDAAVIGTLTEVMAVGPEFEKAKVPLTVLWDSSPEIEGLGDHVFGIGAWAPSTGEDAADFAYSKLNARRAVVINTQNEWPEAVTKFFKDRFEALGGTVVKVFSPGPHDSDFRTVLTKAKQLNPDVLYTPVPNNIVPFYKQLHQVGIKAPVITADVLTNELITTLGAAVEGVYQTLTADPATARTKHMVELYKQKFDREPNMTIFTAWGYDAVHLYAEAIRGGGDLNGELYKIQDFPGASGSISINRAGSSPKGVSVFQIKDGQLLALEGEKG